MREADAEPENVMTGVHTKKLSHQCGECDSEEDPEEDQENGLYEEIYEDPEDVVNEEPEEASEEEIHGESDEDPEDTIVEVSEDDPEEEINEENDCALEDVVYEEPDENPEEDMDEEPEEESEEEIVEDLEDVPGEEIDEEPEEESEEEIIEDLEDKMIQNEKNLKSKSDDTFATSKFDSKIGLISVTVNDDCASRQQEPSKSFRKHRHSRWDVRAEEETPLIDETSKRRKTRWDNDDSRNFLFQVSSSLELSTDQEVLRFKKRLMEINKMLQSSEINGKENAEEISSPKPDNNDHGMKINARARRKLKKSQ
ncbi:uncharacterized protein [Henckelia pumila]|uniref:uncharacterized protein n=1 Tax=Henckelia pumila TaxID=405737 RepID=UPI003C6E141C